jgi:hypothetical protein
MNHGEISTAAKPWLGSDENFNQLYPDSIKLLAKRHWTPIAVAEKAASFLAAENKARILDVGSGVGKFCLAAACYKPSAFFYGVEQRNMLIAHAESARTEMQLGNVSFIHGNFTQLDFNYFDHFYFYNSFYENLSGTDKIDDSIDYTRELYNYYNRILFKKLEEKPAGTRLVTYFSGEEEVPPSFHIVCTDMGNLLKFWIKI